MFLVAALLAQAQVPGMADEEPDVPDWINEIKPADYVLLDADLPSDLHVAGDISAEAQAAEMAVMKDGKADVERVAFVEMHENICQPDPEGVYDCIGGGYILSVYVYETADQAKAVWENTIVEQYGELPAPEGFDYVSNVIAPLDSRFGGEGRCIGPYIWYKNLACTIFGSWDENDNKIGSLWLDKVSNAEPPVQVNLKMREEGLSLIMGYVYDGYFIGTGNYRPLQEIAADKQAIQAQVFNAGDEEAENVYIQFYLQMPGEAEYSKLGDPILVGNVPPGDGRAVYTYWDLGGENLEGATLGAQAYVPGAVDVNPDDDFISITVNVYYAHNGERAYSAVDDAYSFRNYRFNESKTEELADELIATVAAGVPPSIEKDLWLRIFFPTTYSQLWNYFNESYRSGVGGHCYGMAATSALYFTDPSLRPAAKKTYQMSQEEASPNIDIYHRAQMIPVMRSLLSDSGLYFDRGFGQSSSESQSRTYATVKRSLEEDRTPLIISFRGQKNNSTWGHAVLAYKLVEVEGEDYKQIYIYDPNTLMTDLDYYKKPMPVALLWLNGVLYYSVQSGYQDYRLRIPSMIAANPVFRTIPLEEANSLLPDLKKMAKGWIEALKNEKKFAVDLKCPADALFADTSGRRVGTVGGQVVNEIPGAEVMSSGEVEIYLLPMDLEYSLEITGTGSGLVDFDVISPEGEASAKVVTFTNVSIGAGEKLTSEVADGGEIENLKSGTSTIEPSLSGVLDLGAEEGSDETAGGDGAEVGTEDEAAALPAAEQELIFERNSIWAVENNPTSPTSFTIDQECTVTEIKTYHWNYGQGKAPGMIGLQDGSGSVLGMWPASGLPGSGGVPDAYWTAQPNLLLQPGEYTIIDSDPATWSQNAETAGEGIAWVYGLPSEGSGDGFWIESEDLPFADNFNDGEMNGWTVSGLLGSWIVSAEEGVLQQNSNDFGGTEGDDGTYLGTYVTAGGPSWRDYDFIARVKPVDDDGIGLIFRYEDSSNYYRFLWVGDETSTGPLRRLDRIKDGVQTVLKIDRGEEARYDPGRWYNLEVSLDGDVIGVYIDGVLWGEVLDGEIESGGVGLFSYAQVGVEFDDVVVT